MSDCIFCDIVQDPSDAEIVYENESYLAFKDVNPKAPIHILIIPKKHLESFHKISDQENKKLVKWLQDIAWKIIDQKDLDGCQLRMNSGKKYGQMVDHIHLHLLSGDKPQGQV